MMLAPPNSALEPTLGNERDQVSHWSGSRHWIEEAMVEFLPVVVQAEYESEHRIRLVFNDGVEGTVDFADWLEGPVFEPLHDLAYFRRFFVEGGTVGWPNGADIAPETLYEAAKANAAA